MGTAEPVVTDEHAHFAVRVIVGTFIVLAAFVAFEVWRAT